MHTRGDPLGISHCSSNCQNPSHCSVTKHKRRGSEQRQCKITSAIGRALGVGYDDVPASFISQWGVTPCAGGSQLALGQRGSHLFSVCRPFARTSKKSLLYAPWNTCPTVPRMAKPTATDAPSATPTCTSRAETFPCMVNSCPCCGCRALSKCLFSNCLWHILGIAWFFAL